MNRISFTMTLLAVILLSSHLVAQEAKTLYTKESILSTGSTKNVFDKKFRLGVSYNFYWSTIKGNDLPVRYFIKPSIGFNVRAEYYPVPFAGIGIGAGYQQRGAGIRNIDNYGGSFAHPWVKPTGDMDSTYTEKLRFNTWEFPVTLLLRTPSDVIKGMRLSAAAGVIYICNFRTNDIWLDIAGGNHLDNRVSPYYRRNDIGYQISFGPEINAGEANVFQVHFVYSKGGQNVYTGQGDKRHQGNGRQVTFGIRVAWLL